MAVTIKDVAKLAGVSPSTVSRVCNGNPAISSETRERVREAMTQLGYQLPISPEPQAEPAAKTIGIVLPPIDREAYDNPFFLKAIRGISQVCNSRKVVTGVVTGGDYAEILEGTRLMHKNGGADGFVLLYSRKNDTVTEYLRQNGLLHVVVGKAVEPEDQAIYIDNDNLLAGREVTDYLYSLGHRRIGYLGSKNEFLFASDRRSGYQLSLLQHGLPILSDYCVEMEGLSEAGLRALTELLRREDRPTAFVVSDDMLVSALERICRQLGLSVPGDVSVIAFDNSLYAHLLSPQLTSVDINSYRLGQEAAIQLINRMENPGFMAAKILVPHRIVEGDTCRRIEE
ncbi:MAG: LacI family DNA-binding transcriptional regulator [Oscillospiraceae bacterium]|nr:LacI family DNA-binding transcriptional regulator [Oscillospiraceae bacterium]